MENLSKELCRTLFQQIPNGLCLIFAIGALLGMLLVLLKRRQHNPLLLCFGAAVFLMLSWRLVVGVLATRYVAVLVIPAILLTAFVGVRGRVLWYLYCKRFPRLPRWFGTFFARAVLLGCSGGALWMAHHSLTSGQQLHKEMFRSLSEFRREMPSLKVLMAEGEVLRARYYAGIDVIPLTNSSRQNILRKLVSAGANVPVLVVVRARRKEPLLQFGKNELPAGATWKVVKKIDAETRKGKGVVFYLYTPRFYQKEKAL